MKKMVLYYKKTLLFLVLNIFLFAPSYAETINVAVSSNFSYALKSLSVDFQQRTGHQLLISSASTGKLYAQIEHGAPFDIFLSADEKHIDLLIEHNKAQADLAYIYAKGKIVLFSNIRPEKVCQDILYSNKLKHLAVANPEIAPYGFAAKQVMERLSLWQKLKPGLVMGENIAQTLQFVYTKNAQAGFVAKSVLNMGKVINNACVWEVPDNMYSPIKQKMVVLNRSKDKLSAQVFLQYMRSPQAKKIIRASGYDVL